MRNLKNLLGLLLIVASVGAFAGGHANHAKSKSGHHAMHSPDIVDVAIENGNFNTLVTAVQAAGLVDTLKGKGPFTVFAPTDAAFAKLPSAAFEGLLADPDALAKVLTYHVVPGKVLASDVVGLDRAATVQGQAVDIAVRGGKVFIDGAQVVMTDVMVANGVIHVIDRVILPVS